VLFLTLLAAALATTFYVIRDKTPDLMLEVVEMNPRRFSPNGDGKRETITLRFFVRTDEPHAIIEVINSKTGKVVRRLDDDRELRKNVIAGYVWDGTRNSGRPVGDGIYRLRVTLPASDRVIEFPRRFFLERREYTWN